MPPKNVFGNLFNSDQNALVNFERNYLDGYNALPKLFKVKIDFQLLQFYRKYINVMLLCNILARLEEISDCMIVLDKTF